MRGSCTARTENLHQKSGVNEYRMLRKKSDRAVLENKLKDRWSLPDYVELLLRSFVRSAELGYLRFMT